MKQSRLLEIIREEISAALNEAGLGDQITALQKQKDAIEKQKAPLIKKEADVSKKIADLQKKQADAQVKAGAQLEEDLLNEMAWNIVIANPKEKERIQAKIKDSTKKGEQKLAKALEILDDRTSKGLKTRIRDISDEMGVRQQEINPLIGALVDVGVLEKGESVTGVTKKKITDKPQGRPSNPDKPEKAPSTGQRGRPAGTKVATRTAGDDGFDDVSYSDVDDEDKEATQNIGKDKTAKDLGKAADISKNPDFDRIRDGLRNKRKNSKEGVLSPENMKLAIDIINSAKDKYKFNATQVDALRAEIGL